MKRIIALVLMIAMCITVTSASSTILDSKRFEVSGYKLALEDQDTFVVKIASALPDNPEMIHERLIETNDKTEAEKETGKELLIDNYVEMFLGNANTDTPTVPVFSYLLSATKKGTDREIEIKIEPFTNEDGTKTIATKFELINDQLTFLDTNTDTNAEGKQLVELNKLKKENLTTFIKQWRTPKGGNTSIPWVVRGTIAMLIDRNDYMNMDDSTYKAKVTIKIRTL